ncbi:MAG: hypothetical protein HY719_06840 [Planctomycetes bacterium]|nr:hypothetical protein [Planctomycetota bacterium]
MRTVNSSPGRLARGVLLALLVIVGGVVSDTAWSVDTTPLKINFQGRLTDTSGVPVNGSREINFRYYDAATNGTLLYAEARGAGDPVVVTLGNYAVELGAGTRFGGSKTNFKDMFTDTTIAAVWLELQVVNESAMTPRLRLLASPYALNADHLDGQDGVYYTNSDNQSSGTLPVARLPADGYAATYVNTSGDDSMTGNLTVSGTVVGGRTSQTWSASRTGGTASTSWTTIPGLSITFTLARSATVNMLASGEIRSYQDGSYCHIALRFVVDGAGRGDPTHGQRIDVIPATGIIWWQPFALSDYASLAAGSHTIEMQVRESGQAAPHCVVCSEGDGSTPGYTGGALTVSAFYD